MKYKQILSAAIETIIYLVMFWLSMVYIVRPSEWSFRVLLSIFDDNTWDEVLFSRIAFMFISLRFMLFAQKLDFSRRFKLAQTAFWSLTSMALFIDNPHNFIWIIFAFCAIGTMYLYRKAE